MLPEEHLIYLPPALFWNIYKRMTDGKNFLTGVGNKIIINNQSYHFPSTDFYFQSHSFQEPIAQAGVYGIYLNEELLYIGSATDMKTRWKEHDTAFRTKSKVNAMYQCDFDADALTYRALETMEEIMEFLSLEEPSTWIMELVEAYYIKFYQPRFNIEGKTQPFSFQASSRYVFVPNNYKAIIKQFLTSETPRIDIQEQLEEMTKDITIINEETP